MQPRIVNARRGRRFEADERIHGGLQDLGDTHNGIELRQRGSAFPAVVDTSVYFQQVGQTRRRHLPSFPRLAQAGINAGSGGFDIDVKGNTNLTGAVISSAADASQNSLTTGTLTYSDIQNQSHYSAKSSGVSLGVGVNNTGKARGPGSVSGAGGLVPMITQNESGDESATTRSAIGAGTIDITNQGAQTQDVAGLSRDTANTNGTVSSTPDVNQLLSEQADTIQAAQAAGQVVAQGIGAYADGKRQDAEDAASVAPKSGDLLEYDAAMREYESWGEGGENRIALHVAGGALIGGLGGGGFGSAFAGAAGAGLSAAMAKQLEDIYKGVGSATGSELLGNIAANVVAGVGGALVGGSVGASTASNVELYNQSAHRKPKDLVSQVCPVGAQCSDATLNAAIQAQGANAQQAFGAMSPDYVSIQGNIYVASGGVVINLHNGDTFGSWALGKPIPTYSLNPGLSVTFGSILGGGGAEGTSSYLAGGGANASTFIPVPGFPAIGAGGGVSHAYGGRTSIEYGLSFPPGTAVNPVSYGFEMKK